jgi:predicted Zn-ribbon and HTH transcriptional regulator
VAFITTIEDDRRHKLAELVTTHDVYRFADGTGMFVHTHPAWCRDCQAFVLVEDLVDPAKLESRTRDFCAHRAENPLVPFDIIPREDQERMNQSMLAEGLHQASRWGAALRDRVSPPRCLECGGTDHQIIPDDGSWVPHPGKPGVRVRVAPGYCHASMKSAGRVYDTEGRRLAD